MTLHDLPDDILYSIFPYLTAAEFLNLTSSSRSLHRHSEDASFWHMLTLRTFRIPPQPLLQNARWQWLYKKLLTQTRVYTWGNNKWGNLGRDCIPEAPPDRRQLGHSGWPYQIQLDRQVGIIADVQCGGYCTTLLNSIGNIYILGRLHESRPGPESLARLRPLTFPSSHLPNTQSVYNASVAIRQYSVGRSLILGLSDDGQVWLWTVETAVLVKPMDIDLSEHRVLKVVAGWDRSSMYVEDVGIVYWASTMDSMFLLGGQQEQLTVANALAINTMTVPGTNFRRSSSKPSSESSVTNEIGEIKNHIILEGYVVFITHLNKIFSYETVMQERNGDMPIPVDLTHFFQRVSAQPLQVQDVQGSFRKFAIFTATNEILIADNELLDVAHASLSESVPASINPLILPKRLSQPSNQEPTCSLAFGDHHIHALHANGTLTSHGQEPQSCGALGLGSTALSPLRGVVNPGPFSGASLPHEQAKTVWFEPLMQTWLSDMRTKLRHRLHGHFLASIMPPLGRWFEKEGSRWEDGVDGTDSRVPARSPVRTDDSSPMGDDSAPQADMGAYFVLKVAAAGWHSAALVLVDEDKAHRARERHIIRPSSSSSPSRAPSIISSLGSYYGIQSPSDQLLAGVYGVWSFLWGMGRWFLGLTQRDERNRMQGQRQGQGQTGSGQEESVRYTWNEPGYLPLDDILLDGSVPDDGG